MSLGREKGWMWSCRTLYRKWVWCVVHKNDLHCCIHVYVHTDTSGGSKTRMQDTGFLRKRRQQHPAVSRDLGQPGACSSKQLSFLHAQRVYLEISSIIFYF